MVICHGHEEVSGVGRCDVPLVIARHCTQLQRLTCVPPIDRVKCLVFGAGKNSFNLAARITISSLRSDGSQNDEAGCLYPDLMAGPSALRTLSVTADNGVAARFLISPSTLTAVTRSAHLGPRAASGSAQA